LVRFSATMTGVTITEVKGNRKAMCKKTLRRELAPASYLG